MSFGGGAFDGAYSFRSRFEEGTGTNPEELVAAAHAGCFSMALSNGLASAGYTPERVDTTANVHLEQVEEGFGITRIVLVTRAKVPEIEKSTFNEHVETARKNCPISKLFKGAEIEVEATLE